MAGSHREARGLASGNQGARLGDIAGFLWRMEYSVYRGKLTP